MRGLKPAFVWYAVLLSAFLLRKPIRFDAGWLSFLPPVSAFGFAMLRRTALLSAELGLVLVASWGCGRAVLGCFMGERPEPSEALFLEVGLGLGLLTLLGLGLGCLGLARPPLLQILLVLLFTAGCAGLRIRKASAPLPGFSPFSGATAPLLALAILAGYAFLIALGPPTFYDGLVYHLALPAIYLRRGAIVAVPMNVFAGLPQGIEMLYLWLLPWPEGASLCQLLNWALGVLAALSLIPLSRRIGSSYATGCWAAAIFFSNPMILLSSGKPAVELGWSFLLALSLLALAIHAETRERAWLPVIGILVGLAIGTKYQAVLLAPAVAVFLRFHRADGKTWRDIAKIWLFAGLAVAPWIMRNAALYHNPVYPFLDGTLFAPSGFVEPGGLGRSAWRGVTTWAGLKSFLLHPWTYSLPGPLSFKENTASLAYLALLPAFLCARRDASLRKLLTLTAALWLPMNLLSSEARYSIPALVPLSLAAAISLSRLPDGLLAPTRRLLIGIFALNGLFAFEGDMRAFWPSLEGGEPQARYLSHRHPAYPCPPYPAFQWANQRLPPASKVLFLGEGRSFYLERDSESASPYAFEPLILYANAAPSGEGLYRELRQRGFSHVFINGAEIVRRGGRLRISPRGWANLQSFWRAYVKLLYMDRNEDPEDARSSLLYEILSPDEARRAHPAPFFPLSS